MSVCDFLSNIKYLYTTKGYCGFCYSYLFIFSIYNKPFIPQRGAHIRQLDWFLIRTATSLLSKWDTTLMKYLNYLNILYRSMSVPNFMHLMVLKLNLLIVTLMAITSTVRTSCPRHRFQKTVRWNFTFGSARVRLSSLNMVYQPRRQFQ